MNDGQFGMEVMHLTKHGMPLDTVTWTTPDLAELCRGYGGSGRVVRSVADLDGLAEELAQTDQWPVLLDVRIDPSLAAH
jgi:thiamine pyrophosphate-dependent acetolactate synthase large subunit-like protein